MARDIPTSANTLVVHAASVLDGEPIRLLAHHLGADADLHLVGGVLRDMAEGIPPSDIDVATVLRPDEVKRRLEARNVRVIETGIEHGTVLALLGEAPIEITTFRVPGTRSGSAYSDSILIDLEGRDFTINAIALHVGERRVCDPFGGLDDVRNRVIRGVSDPLKRFQEDPLRVLRMVRFGHAAGRSVEPATARAAEQCAGSVAGVSIERIRVEFERILCGSHVADGLRELARLGILLTIVPELEPCIGFEQNEFHNENVFDHIVSVVAKCAPDLRLRLAALFHDIAKPQSFSVGEDGRRHFYKHETLGAEIVKDRLARLTFSRSLADEVETIVRHHMRPVDCGPAGIRRLLRDLGPLFPVWRELKLADATPTIPEHEVLAQLEDFDARVKEELTRAQGSVFEPLALRGDDLIAMGIPEGPRIGFILKALRELVIERPDSNTREALTAEVERIRASIDRPEGPK